MIAHKLALNVLDCSLICGNEKTGPSKLNAILFNCIAIANQCSTYGIRALQGFLYGKNRFNIEKYLKQIKLCTP